MEGGKMEDTEKKDKTIQLDLPPELHARIKSEADRMGVAVAALVKVALSERFDVVKT
jgi:predicted HicB family RNase H-like nuclease